MAARVTRRASIPPFRAAAGSSPSPRSLPTSPPLTAGTSSTYSSTTSTGRYLERRGRSDAEANRARSRCGPDREPGQGNAALVCRGGIAVDSVDALLDVTREDLSNRHPACARPRCPTRSSKKQPRFSPPDPLSKEKSPGCHRGSGTGLVVATLPLHSLLFTSRTHVLRGRRQARRVPLRRRGQHPPSCRLDRRRRDRRVTLHLP